VAVASRAGGSRGRSGGHGTRAEAGEEEKGRSSQVTDVDYALGRERVGPGVHLHLHIADQVDVAVTQQSFLRTLVAGLLAAPGPPRRRHQPPDSAGPGTAISSILAPTIRLRGTPPLRLRSARIRPTRSSGGTSPRVRVPSPPRGSASSSTMGQDHGSPSRIPATRSTE
jgi:hypothetical protein